ncbi:TolC family protein [Mucilaginibacter sp. BT774]|uniref:TolC family protein n=1 Tax=Mucilaginibacter sp. BT774 TaxID=3062276 RepID=UPI0026746B81|nr:TolC family protein [Mucilaginibacter sp. BT774]MDO3626662.1 TolC family protein [Mucilaginibacter sp. BT774]
MVKPLYRFAIAIMVPGLMLTSAASAQDRTLTLDEAIKLGIQNSKVLKLSQSKIDQAVSKYNQAKDEVLPTGSASFGYNRAEIPANHLALGKASFNLPSSADAYLGIVSLKETIFAGGKLKLAQQSTDLLTRVSRLDADKDKDEIAYDVITSFYNLYKVLQSKKVVEQNLKSIDEQIHQSQRFFDQGLVTKNDVLRFQLQRSNVELNGIDLESNRKIINYDLDILLGLPETTQINIDQIKETDRQIGSISSYIDTAMANRQEVQQLVLQSKVADNNIKTIHANQLPTLAASAGGYYVDVSANPLPQSGKYITPLTVGLTFSWNFSSLWTNKNKVTEAKIEREQVSINQGITADNIRKDVNRSYQGYEEALNKIKLLQTSIDQAGENDKILQSKYKNNVASATDRADAETLLYQAQINLELAKADAGLAYYTLLKSTGKLNK